MSEKKNQFVCAFCGRNSRQSKELFIPSMYEGLAICSECSRKVSEVMREAETARAAKSAPLKLEVPSPAAIREELDKYVIGQEAAKKTLAVAVHNH